MKKYYIILFLAVLAASGFSQEIKISVKALPAAIVKSFRLEYPNAHIKNATREIKNGDTVYEVSSKDSLTKRTITFHSNGIPIEIEESMTIDQLPISVTTAIAKQYPKGKVMSIDMSMKGPVMTYEVLIKDNKKKFEVVYDMSGNVVPKK
jgi:uncharacterized membrane protein YkoI